MKVIVTGAGGALGGAVVRKFLNENWAVFGIIREGERTFAHENLEWVTCNLADPVQVQQAVGRVQNSPARQGGIEAFIHCAGGFRYATLEHTTDSDFDFLFESNLKSAFLVTREILPAMRRNNSGKIVFVGSNSAARPPAGMSVYGAFKAGLQAFAAGVSEEVRGTKISVNTVLPSVLDTPANREAMPALDFSQWVGTAELADIIFSFTQKWGGPIRGAAIPIVGGV